MKRSKSSGGIIGIILSIIFIVLGVVFVVKPDIFISSVGLILGIGLIIVGFFMAIFSFFLRYTIFGFILMLLLGISFVGFGISFIVDDGLVSTLIPVILFIYLFITGINKLTYALKLNKLKDKHWFIPIIFSIIYIVLSFFALIFRSEANDTLAIVVGVMFIVIGAISLIDYSIGLKDSKKVEKRNKKIEEAQSSYENSDSSIQSSKLFDYNESDVIEGEIVGEEDNRKDD